jgi:hypothetical protein
MNWYKDFKTGKKQDERIAMEGAYFMNTFKWCVIKISKQGDCYARFSGKEEYKLDTRDDLVSGAKLENREITIAEYQNY